jgi:hypothetical protein
MPASFPEFSIIQKLSEADSHRNAAAAGPHLDLPHGCPIDSLRFRRHAGTNAPKWRA